MTMLTSYNPTNKQVIGEVCCASEADVEKVVVVAQQALKAWRASSLSERAACLKQAAISLAAGAEDIGQLIHQEMGRPLVAAVSEAQAVGAVLNKKIDSLVAALSPHNIEDDSVHSTFYYEALGVCAAITPWNFPVNMAQWMILPALMAGNTVVLKPSEETPLAVQKYVDVLNEFLPEGVLQIIHGGKETGRALVNADVQLIAFTGSRRAGQQILADCAKDFKRIILELGGKDPLLVLDDADIEAAAQFAVQNSFFNSGQVCVSSERIYVHESIAAAFENELLKISEKVKLTPYDGDEEESVMTIGPMVADFQRQHVLRQLDSAIEDGADVLLGGKDHPEGYIRPTVLRVDDSMDIMQEETFGPVACVRHFTREEEVIEKINDSIYGLSAVIFSGDNDRAVNLARKIETGMVGINKGCRGAEGTPWIGAKQSGYNYHGGEAGDRQFSQIKIVSWPK